MKQLLKKKDRIPIKKQNLKKVNRHKNIPIKNKLSSNTIKTYFIKIKTFTSTVK